LCVSLPPALSQTIQVCCRDPDPRALFAASDIDVTQLAILDQATDVILRDFEFLRSLFQV
jgi:hypothetical protein